MLKTGLEGTSGDHVLHLSAPRQDQHTESVPQRCLPKLFLDAFKDEGSTTLGNLYICFNHP